MKIYTKTGDAGETGLLGGVRVRKDSARIEAYGTVDELNALLGTARTEELTEDLNQLIETIQHQLFQLGAELAAPDAPSQGTTRIDDPHVRWLEERIDSLDSGLPPLKSFILPGGTRAAATLHVARSVCRRAERRVVQLGATESVSTTVVTYLNRLGDLLFVVARFANHSSGIPDVLWKQ